MSFVCPFCDESNRIIPDVNQEEVESHLLVTMIMVREHGKNKRLFHVHGELDNKPLIREFVRTICKEAGIEVEG